jgi:hypothetical protein
MKHIIKALKEITAEKFDKNKWIAFAKETVKYDEPQLIGKLDFNKFGTLMEKVNNAAGEIESVLWSGANPSGTEDRTWVRVWAYLSNKDAKMVYEGILTGMDSHHANRILGAFRTVGFRG